MLSIDVLWSKRSQSKKQSYEVVILRDLKIKRWLFYAMSILFLKERAIWYSNMTRPWCPGAFTTIPAIRLGFPDVGPRQGRGERDTFRLRIINSDNDSFLLRVVLDFGSTKQHHCSYLRLGLRAACFLRFWSFWMYECGRIPTHFQKQCQPPQGLVFRTAVATPGMPSPWVRGTKNLWPAKRKM